MGRPDAVAARCRRHPADELRRLAGRRSADDAGADRLLPRDDPHRPADESLPATLLVWTWLGYVLGNLFWFGTASVALVGGVLLGLLVLPYLWSMWQDRA
jgi:hypothetical protein